jgi:hypothetical protein
MSKIKRQNPKEGEEKWAYFRKPKFKRKSKLRQTMWVAKMINICSALKNRLELKRTNGTLVSKRIEYGQTN